MRAKTESDQTQTTSIDPKKATKGEIVRQIESKLRTYQYQKEIQGQEEWTEYKISKQQEGQIIQHEEHKKK